jgi:hypothetical protein
MGKTLQFHSSWESLREKIKETNTTLTDGDLEYIPGREDELCDRLAEKLHKNKEELIGWLESLDENKAMAG